jgi:hypothetical protein
MKQFLSIALLALITVGFASQAEAGTVKKSKSNVSNNRAAECGTASDGGDCDDADASKSAPRGTVTIVKSATASPDESGAGAAEAQDHNSSRSNKTSSVAAPSPDGDGLSSQTAVSSPRDAASGQATGKRQHKPSVGMAAEEEPDGTPEPQGMAINEKGLPGGSTKAKTGKSGSTK